VSCATPKSAGGPALRTRSGWLWALVTVLCLVFNPAVAEVSDAEALARSGFYDAEKALNSDPRSTKAGWEYARACFRAAEFATNNAERAILSEKGIAAAQAVIARDPGIAQANYYLGLNYGQLARTKGIGALKVVDQIERYFLIARDLDSSIDFGGPERCLGLLYRDAPAWISVGSRKKARSHLEAAIKAAPTWPDNRLNLIETLLDWNDRNGALREYKALKQRWESDLKSFSAPKWQSDVTDWKTRYLQVSRRIEEPLRPLESPRGGQD
jgi:tetratricopeptide (TPR) repeat protein